jgi:hypothetical protein
VRIVAMVLFSLSGCRDVATVSTSDGGGSAPTRPTVSQPQAEVTPARVEAWLSWQRSLAAVGLDGGVDLRSYARLDAALLAVAGLTDAQADAVEAVVAAVVAERSVARLSGGEALSEFRSGLAQLQPEQRLKAEAAVADLQTKSNLGAMAALEAQFGRDAVKAVLAREAEVTTVWDALLEAKATHR